MSKRDFFRTIIKIFGLYSLILSIFQLIPTLTSFSYMGLDFWYALIVLGSTLIIVGIYLFLINKPDLIIDRLNLDKGFDDSRIEFGNFDSEKLIYFATILIGGFLIIDYFPSFINNCYYALKETVQTKGFEDYFTPKTQYFDWAIAIMNIALGYLLLTNYKNVAKWISKTNNKNNG